MTVLCGSLEPYSTLPAPGFHDAQMPLLRQLLNTALATLPSDEQIAWFYTPMALPLLGGLHPNVIVCDCMEELIAFMNAAAELIRRERNLIRIANFAFAGGPSLFASKKSMHANAHCFPSSVDAEHFSQALHVDVPEYLSALPSPRLGYFGVVCLSTKWKPRGLANVPPLPDLGEMVEGRWRQ